VAEDREIEELKRKRMLELQARIEEQQKLEAQRRQFELQKRMVIQQLVTPEARSRLANLRAAKPEFVEQIELQLIQLAQSGRLTSKITDDQLKEILKKLQSRRRVTRIKRV
jgi:programmed cell death protein 5